MANGKGCHKIVHLDLSGCEQVMKGLGQAVINRAVYTRENKPRLTIAAACIRREHPV